MSPSTEPFNESRYKALVDGLECTEILFSSLERTARVDAEFYRKGNLEISAFLKKKTLQPFTESFSVSDGNHMSISDSFCDEGIPYYRGQDIYNVFIEEASPICIDRDTYNHPHMNRSHLKNGDVLMSIVGAIVGNSAIVTSDSEATCSCKLAIIRSKQKDILPEFLLTFIKTKYGQNQIQKFKRGAAQTGLLLEDFDQLFVPVLSSRFQEQVRNIIHYAQNNMAKGSEVYKNAMAFLMSTLRYNPDLISKKGTSEKLLSDSFGISGRLDAEYYQQKYDDIESILKEYDHSITSLSDIATYVFTGQYSEEYYNKGDLPNLRNYIRGTDILSGQVEQDDTHCVNPKGFSKFVSTGDIVTGRVGTIGNFGVITDNMNGAICSDNILCFHLPPRYLPDVYALYFNSDLAKALTIRMARGSVQQRLNQETLRKIPVPLIKHDTQIAIEARVQESFVLRHQAEKLIETAVKAVEIAIEQDEDAAIVYIQNQIHLQSEVM
ncbi:MAG: restriction endonuclease subunit S [Eubacterium sp.]|nr:restriction endonuclease subunit S [Eubacterium sp.]